MIESIGKVVVKELVKRAVVDNTTTKNSTIDIDDVFDAFRHLGDFSVCRVPVETNSSTCEQLDSAFTTLISLNIFLAFVAMVGMQFMQKRVKKCSGVWERPGILIPVNLLNHTKYRLIYVAIFGSMSSIFFNVITGGAPSISTSDPYSQSVLSIIVTLLFVMVICITYYPLFASVDTPVPIVGHVIGTFFAAFLLVNTLIREYRDYTGCSNGCQSEGLPFAIKFLSDAPVVLLELFLVLWFLGSIGYDIYVMIVPSKHTPSKYYYLKDHLERVKHRLRREEIEYSEVKKGLKKFILKIYPYDSGFKFPQRFLAGMVVAIVIVYQMSFLTIFQSIRIAIELESTRKQLFKSFDELNDVVKDAGVTGEAESAVNQLHSLVKLLGYSMSIFGVMLNVAIITALIFCAVQFFLTFRNVSEHLHQVTSRGKLSFLSNDFPSIHRSVLSSFRYPGYLIAYSVWAWLVYALLLILLVTVLMIAAILLYYLTSFLGPYIAVAIIGLAWTQGLYWSQFFITKYVFLEKAYPDSDHQVLNNRRLMHWFTYFLIFQNAFVGVFSTFIRIIMSFAFGLLTFSRLDRVLLIKGLESFDAAHRTYIGMIYLDYTENNSVMIVFCHILLQQLKLKKQHSGELVEPADQTCICCEQQSGSGVELENVVEFHQKDEEDDKESPSRPYVSQRAYNRWRVAYTLIRNEQLTGLTATNLSQNKKKSLRERMGHLNEVYGIDGDEDDEDEAEAEADMEEQKDFDEYERL